MKTEDLIRAVAADNESLKWPIGRTITLALGIGTFVAAVAFLVLFGLRSDFSWVLVNSPRFDFKLLFTMTVAACAFALTLRLARPGQQGRFMWWAFAFPFGALAIAAAMELYALPQEHWLIYAQGQNWLVCMMLIPLLSLAPFAAILYALRQGAPDHPARAGAAGGILSAAIGATLYATHCADDSPLFVIIWYPIGMALVTIAGLYIGRRWLRW